MNIINLSLQRDLWFDSLHNEESYYSCWIGDGLLSDYRRHRSDEERRRHSFEETSCRWENGKKFSPHAITS